MFTYMRSIDFRFMSKVYSFMKCLVLNLKQKLTAIYRLWRRNKAWNNTLFNYSIKIVFFDLSKPTFCAAFLSV